VLGVECCSVSRVFVLVFPVLVGLLVACSGLYCLAKDGDNSTQEQLLNNTDPSATASAQSPAVDEDEPRQSLQPPPASAAAESAKADIVTGPTEADGPGSRAKFKVLALAFGIRSSL